MRRASTSRFVCGTGSDVDLGRSRPAEWWFAAALAPLLALGASLVVNVEARNWLHISRPLIQSLIPDALLYSAWALVVGAPLAGVVRASQPRTLVVAVVLFVSVSATMHLGAFGVGVDTLTFVTASHTTVASAAMALVALGALCAVTFRDQLDAAAAALTAVVVLSAGVLVAGAPVADAPRAVIEAALTASPVVAIASAAGIDLARTEVLYQVSPLARLRFEYPTWYVASAWYLGAACLMYIAASRMLRTLDSCPQLKGFSCPSCREF
jgi:hypothetical protein